MYNNGFIYDNEHMNTGRQRKKVGIILISTIVVAILAMSIGAFVVISLGLRDNGPDERYNKITGTVVGAWTVYESKAFRVKPNGQEEEIKSEPSNTVFEYLFGNDDVFEYKIGGKTAYKHEYKVEGDKIYFAKNKVFEEMPDLQINSLKENIFQVQSIPLKIQPNQEYQFVVTTLTRNKQ